MRTVEELAGPMTSFVLNFNDDARRLPSGPSDSLRRHVSTQQHRQLHSDAPPPGPPPQQQQQQNQPPPSQQQVNDVMGGGPDHSHRMDPPPLGVYHGLDELISNANAHAQSRGYKLVVVRSKTNAQGQKTWVHLACDRHGTKRNTHNLTPETRKKNRRSRRCECPMYCVAAKTTSDLWELTVRNAEHNHGPYEPPPKKKKDLPAPRPSEMVNLPLLQTPSWCSADFCLIPIGTPTASVSNEIAEVQRLLKRSDLHYAMHAAGTTVEGSWDNVMKIIGQAHALLHGSGCVRIQTDIRIGTRTDKKQSFDDKVASVRALLDGQRAPGESDDGIGEDADDTTMQEMSRTFSHGMNSAIAPELQVERSMPPPPPMNHSMQHPMAHPNFPHVQHQIPQGMHLQ